MNIINLTILLAVLTTSTSAYAGGEKPTGQMPRGGNENNIGVYSNSQGGNGGQGGFGGNVNDGAIRNNVTGIAAGGVTAQGGGSESTFSVGGRGIGNNSFNYPRQAPPIMGYGSYSQASCMGSFGASGSGGGGGGGLLLPWESDACNHRLNSAHMNALGKPKTACYVMADEFDDVSDAMEKSGETCSVVTQTSVAMPVPGAIVPAVTPALDGYDHRGFVTRPELDEKLDFFHKKEMGK